MLSTFWGYPAFDMTQTSFVIEQRRFRYINKSYYCIWDQYKGPDYQDHEKLIEFLIDQREFLLYYRIVWTFVLFGVMIYLQHTTTKFKQQTQKKPKMEKFDGGINKSLATTNESMNVSQNILEQTDEIFNLAIELSNQPISDELKIFNSIQELNWAWIFFSLKDNTWTQFECLNCMILESKYQLWKNDPAVSFEILVQKLTCSIYFDKMVAVAKDSLDNLTTFMIKRTEKNVRQRPNAE